MRLGDLIDTLEQFDPTLPVIFSDGSHPLRLASWRGVYAELSLEPVKYEGDVALGTVGELLKEARRADGATFQGYKGGDYRMSRDTPVWADAYGEYDHNIITGVQLVDGILVLNRVHVPVEYT